jgi:hypothetical protein
MRESMEARMKTKLIAMGLLLASGCEPVTAHFESMHARQADPHAAPGPAAHGVQSGTTTVDLQGGYNEWKASPFIHQFYDLTKASFANGADKVDFAAYQEKSYAIFRAFGAASGGGKAAEEGMLDHLKDIPRQIVGIVKGDPGVLDSYDKFWIAMAGPP